MAETSTPRPTSIEKNAKTTLPGRKCGPKKSTIAFLRQFARAYNSVTDMRGPIGDLVIN